MKNISPIRQFILPIILMVIFFWSYHNKIPFMDFWGVGFFLALAWLASNVLKAFIWGFLLERTFNVKVPRLIKDFFTIIIYFVGILLIISQVYGKSISALVAASGIMGLIIGMAIQNIINDLFSGLALNFDSNFQIGSTLRINEINQKGKIREITWRSTRMDSEGTGIIIIPNSIISTMTVSNLSYRRIAQMDLSLSLDAKIPTEHAIPILISALQTVSGVLQKPRSTVRVSRFNEDGILYKLYYWIEPLKSSNNEIRSAIFDRILTHFRIAGLPLSSSKKNETNSLSITPQANPENLLENCNLFKNLLPEEKSFLANHMQVVFLKKGIPIVEEGSIGDSMFILVEGFLDIFLRSQDSDKKLRVGYLKPGDFFGETSLLTGAPRSATIIPKTNSTLFEIKKALMEELFKKRPEMAESLSQLLAERQTSNKNLLADLTKEKVEMNNAVKEFYNNIKRFFKL